MNSDFDNGKKLLYATLFLHISNWYSSTVINRAK